MMKGFFDKKETQSVSRPDGKTYSCISCGLMKDSTTPKMKPKGSFAKGILNIGVSPNQQDDLHGSPFTGKRGRYLKTALQKHGIDLWEDCLNLNAVNCLCEKPTPYQLNCCRKSVLQTIKEYQPSVILLHGEAPTVSVIGHRWKQDFGNIQKWRGWTIPDEEMNAWLCPMLDLDTVITFGEQYETIWQQDLTNALSRVNAPFPKYKKPVIDVIEELRELDSITGGMVAFDYETTGLKPHAPGHQIISTSVATSTNHVYVFMMPEDLKQTRPFRRLLRDLNVGKIAQNMKFEHAWSLVKLGVEVRHWIWDTMQATHIFDNRPGITGLKFQTYVQFGVIDYSSDVAPYLQSAQQDSNGINRIMELVNTKEGREKLLKYCALDSIYEYRLAEMQMDTINYFDLPF